MPARAAEWGGFVGASPDRAINNAAPQRELERNNLFVVPLDEERLAYRYHHLFGQYLRAEHRRGHQQRTCLGEGSQIQCSRPALGAFERFTGSSRHVADFLSEAGRHTATP